MSATGYISMNQRTSPTLTLRYGSEVINIPITERSVRRFRLMQEDFIQLEFSLPTAIHVGIGDYIFDPLFGRYYITEEKMPKFNAQTGGYDYSLRFDADYFRWRNTLHCLVSNTNKRMETSWHLTDRLEVQAMQIAANVNIAYGYEAGAYNPQAGYADHDGYGIVIEESATSASEVKLLSFEGTDIISALNMIAEAWNCEWWVTDDKVIIGELRYAHTIHFGKCELDNEPIEFALGDNVESMDIARDQQTYATRIYGYGGTRNVPDTYDRELIFTASILDQNGFKDSDRPLSIDMILGQSTATVVPITINNSATSSANVYTQTSQHVFLNGAHTLSGSLAVRMTLASSDWQSLGGIPEVKAKLILHVGNTSSVLDESGTLTHYDTDTSGNTKMWEYGVTLNSPIPATSNTDVYLEVQWTLLNSVVADIDSASFYGSGSTAQAVSGEASSTKQVYVTRYGDSNRHQATYYGDNGYIKINSSTPVIGRNTKYTLSPLSVNVPVSYYTRNYVAEGMSAVGDKRIHLPGLRYRDAAGATAIIEKMVVWEDEYPKLTLRIKQGTIWTSTKTDTIEHSDGSISRENWTQYSFQAEYTDDGGESWQDFVFDTDWIMDGNKLQVAFSSPASAQSSGWMLGGMTFDVGYNANLKRFTIIRNEDFGAALPNDYIKPTALDEFTLVGWNPSAMEELGLITASQNRLVDKVNEYLQALQDGQFAFTCKMMSDVLFTAQYGGGSVGNENLKTYGLLAVGAKVSISHDALPNGSKQSRIIGYEYKLDMPYDTPTYIVGETEAYSRLKQIEKQLKLQ